MASRCISGAVVYWIAYRFRLAAPVAAFYFVLFSFSFAFWFSFSCRFLSLCFPSLYFLGAARKSFIIALWKCVQRFCSASALAEYFCIFFLLQAEFSLSFVFCILSKKHAAIKFQLCLRDWKTIFHGGEHEKLYRDDSENFCFFALFIFA